MLYNDFMNYLHVLAHFINVFINTHNLNKE